MRDIADLAINITRSSIYQSALLPLLNTLLEAQRDALETVDAHDLRFAQGKVEMLRELIMILKQAGDAH